MNIAMPHATGDEAAARQGYKTNYPARAGGRGGEDPPSPSPQHPSFQRPPRAPPNRPPPRRVDHTYRNYSNFPVGDLLSGGKKVTTNFPTKLYHILSTPEYSHIISWMPHGRAWKIHDKELLMREVAPKYFVQSKYESFTRQLNGWGFKRLHQSGNDFNAYYHECFLRGLLHLPSLMRRVAPNKGKLLPHVEGEPNFYEVEKRFPLPSPAPPIPMMPYHNGHYYSQPSHVASVGYGALPEPMTMAGYHDPSNYSSYPSNCPPQPHHYNGSQAAPPAYPVQYDNPYYPTTYPSQYNSQLQPENYPQQPSYSTGPSSYGIQSQYEYDTASISKNNNGPAMSVQIPMSPSPHQGLVQEEKVATSSGNDTEPDYFEPLSIFTDA